MCRFEDVVVYVACESQQDKHSHIARKYAWSALARSKIRLCVKGDEHRINFSSLGPVVRRPISANQGLNFNPDCLSPHDKDVNMHSKGITLISTDMS